MIEELGEEETSLSLLFQDIEEDKENKPDLLDEDYEMLSEVDSKILLDAEKDVLERIEDNHTKKILALASYLKFLYVYEYCLKHNQMVGSIRFTTFICTKCGNVKKMSPSLYVKSEIIDFQDKYGPCPWCKGAMDTIEECMDEDENLIHQNCRFKNK